MASDPRCLVGIYAAVVGSTFISMVSVVTDVCSDTQALACEVDLPDQASSVPAGYKPLIFCH